MSHIANTQLLFTREWQRMSTDERRFTLQNEGSITWLRKLSIEEEEAEELRFWLFRSGSCNCVLLY